MESHAPYNARPTGRMPGDWVLGLKFRVSLGVIAGLVTIVLGAFQAWMLVTAVIIATLGLGAASWFVQFYSRQVIHRETSTIEHLRASFEKELEDVQKAVRDLKFRNQGAAEALHLLIHCCRDSATDLKKRYEALPGKPENPRKFLEDVQELGNRFFERVLNRMIAVFAYLVPPQSGQPVHLWAAIREIRKIGGKNFYVTLLRAGEFNPNRESISEPVAEDEGLPRALREAHRNRRGIIIVPQHKPAELWRPMISDACEEDQSVMAGPIILKSSTPAQMPMILYLNSPQPGAFGAELIPYMKCCTDLVSTVLNILTEILVDVRDTAGEPGT